MAENLNCWKCGASLAGVVLPLGRRDECPACGADLHVCRMCGFYDPAVSKDCRETMADEVAEKERANFCDYFRPAAGAGAGPEGGEAAAAKAKLEALFGGEPKPQGGALGEDAATAKADAQSDAAADSARQRLDKLFDKGSGGKDRG